MSLPYVKCSKCGARNSPPKEEDYFLCVGCGYLEPKGSVVLESNKDYEDERERRIEVRDEELKKWEEGQRKLCEKIIKDCLPNRNVKITFQEKISWGETIYYENDLVASQKASQKCLKLMVENRLLEAAWLERYGIGGLTKYNQAPCEINISLRTLKTKHGLSTYNPKGVGFLPTSTHEAAHASPETTHNPKFQPWINKGHDDVWRKVAIKFHDDMKVKYGKEIEERFKKLEEIKKEK